jgi:hypothetical protein
MKGGSGGNDDQSIRIVGDYPGRSILFAEDSHQMLQVIHALGNTAELLEGSIQSVLKQRRARSAQQAAVVGRAREPLLAALQVMKDRPTEPGRGDHRYLQQVQRLISDSLTELDRGMDEDV